MTKGERGTRELFGIFRVLRPEITGRFRTIFGFLYQGMSIFNIETAEITFLIKKALTTYIF